MTNMVDAAGTSAYADTAGNQLWTEDGPWASDTVTNTYNNRLRTGLVLQQSAGSWTNGFGYDAAKRLTNVASSAGSFGYTYASTASRLTRRIALPNTSYITNTYDTMARLSGTYLETSGNVVTNKHEYGYNAGNQRINSTNLAGTNYTNTYDKIGQLKVADSSVNSEDRRYGYDAAWNLNYRTNNTTVYTFTVDGKNQLTRDPDSVTNYSDGNGNLTNRDPVMAAPYDYSYDDENQLTSAQKATLWRTEFVYDGKGRMRKRLEYTWSGSAWSLSTTTWYVYDGMRVIQERNASNVPQVSYTRGSDLSGSLEGAGGIGGLLGRSHAYQTGSGTFTNHNYYHADGNGNVTYMLNSAQSRVAEYRYDPFGNTISAVGSLSAANVYRFSSKEIHVNSGMYYYGYRFYDPNLQRWLNRDPIGEYGGLNLYGMGGNDPVNRIDFFGLAYGNPVPPIVITLPPLPPHYDPGYWNDKGPVQNGNNCYSYACNRPTLPGGKPRPKGKPQPGGGCGADCKSVIDGAKRDGLLDPAPDGSCPSGFHPVQAVVDPGVDYHWYRQDDGGNWSHKPGWGDASDRDASGNPITDPGKANRDYSGTGGPNYSKDCGKLCAPN